MAPKKPMILDEHSWRAIIENTTLNEEKWKVKVIMIESAGSDQDRIYLNKFEAFAAEERRFVIKNICKTETIFMVNQLGGEKKVKDLNLRVFEEGQSYLKDKKEIPSDIVALIIKHLILKMKEEYLFIRLQRLQVREGLRRESATILDKTEIRGTVNVKSPEPIEPAPQKGIPEPDEGKKYNTQLRIRGEEWRDKVYVDDYPTDGPNLYVAITGFVDPHLPGCLIKIGIPMTAVVQIRIDPSTTKVPSTLFRATKRGQSQTEILTEKSLKFWEELQMLRIGKTTADDLKKTAFVVFSPPYWNSENLSGNADKIYDELCFLMYDVQDLTRQHHHYLENMDIISIPEDTKEPRYYNYFCKIIDDLPLECLTMYSVLDSILHIVCKSQDIDNSTSRTSLSAAMSMQPPKQFVEKEKTEKAETLMKDVYNTLCKTEANRKAYRLTYGEEYETHKNPIIINYGDIAKYNTFHLGNINLDNIVWSSLLNMPLHNLWYNQERPQGELEAKNNFHVNVLLSCFQREDVETAELNRLLHILACRKLYNNKSSLKKRHLPAATILEFKKNYLKRSILAEPLTKRSSMTLNGYTPSFPSMTKSQNISPEASEDDPEAQRIKLLFECPDISELVSAAEITNQKPIDNLIDEFEYFEDFYGISALQVMQDAFSHFNCVDYKYCEVTDCFLLMFFNSHDKEGIAREEWRCHLSTPLCLQDFFDFVLEEQYEWIQSEERIYDKNFVLNSYSECGMYSELLSNKSCIEDTDIPLDLLMEGSLKHQDIVDMEEASADQTRDSKLTSKQAINSPTSTAADVSLKSSKKAAATKNIHKSFGLETESKATAVPAKPFLGFDLGDRRVEVFGKDAIYFSKDGTRVSSMYTLIIPINVEYIIMNVVPGNSNNEFWVNRALGDSIPTDIVDMCESFRITSKDQVLINIKKQTYQLPILTNSPSESVRIKENLKSPSSKLVQPPQVFETKVFHSLIVTWPNGLITESVHENCLPDISHIKQYYINSIPDLNEEMRCISLNGEVVIFKTSGVIEVLSPDGSYIKITNCKKQIIVPEIPEESEVNSEKNKKLGKGKSKEKSSKASSKTSKNMVEEVLDEIPHEYELVIDEFESIATSGLRQKWINDTPTDIEKLLIRTATDSCQGEIFSRRMDGTHCLLNKDGIQVVTFPNKTRIITRYVVEDEEIFPEWTEEERELLELLDFDKFDAEMIKSKSSGSQRSYVASTVSSMSRKIEEEEVVKKKERTDGYISVKLIYTIEHSNFTTVTINKVDEKISIDSPNNTTVEVDTANSYNIILDKLTTAQFNGQNLHINYEACPECRSYTTCDIKIRTNDDSSVTKAHQHWLKMKDSYYKRIIVNEEGSISLNEEPCSEEVLNNVDDLATTDDGIDVNTEVSVPKTDSSVISHGKCREMYLAKTMRFFVLQRDLTCSELVHRALLEQYKNDCRWQPWYSINNCDSFGDHRSLISILTPVHATESEKWLMESNIANKPKYLTYKDLKMDSGKGFYHWMRPYGRFDPKPMKPENVLLPRLPRAFMLRTLEHQWKESEREELKGARELLNAILKYRQLMETDMENLLHIPIQDLRTEDEKRTDEYIQALAHKVYEDLKAKLAADVQSRAKASITTKPAPPPSPEEMSIEGEMSEVCWDDIKLKCLEEEREDQLKKAESGEEMSPSLKRYWRRRGEEFKEEQFYQYLLREGSVPPYFRNVLGGAFWWEMNSTAGEAVTMAERRKMKCVCETDSTPSATTDQPFM